MYNFPVWREPPVRDWLFHPERFLFPPGRKKALRHLCQKLDINPVFTAEPAWLGMWATIGVLLAYKHGRLKRRGRKKSQTAGDRTDVQWVKVPVRDWPHHPEHFFAAPERAEALRQLCQKLNIEPIFTAGTAWLGMWATIGALLAYEHGGLKRRGPKTAQTPRSRKDIEIVEAIEYVAQKRKLPFEHLLPYGIRWAQESGRLTPSDRTTDPKRLKRVKRLLDEKRRPPAGLLHLLMSDGDLE